MTTARDWAPVFPDCPATTGSKTARAVNRAMVLSNIPTTNAARKAVNRFSCNQGNRFLTENHTGESARSSLFAPTIVSRSALASSWLALMISSFRTTPKSRWSKSTTGMVKKCRSPKSSTISSRDSRGWIVGRSWTITDCNFSSGSTKSKSRTETRPTSFWARSIT